MFKNGSLIGVHNVTSSSVASGIFDLNSHAELSSVAFFPSFGRFGAPDTNHVHTASINTATFAPTIHYIETPSNDDDKNYSVMDFNFTSGSNAVHTVYIGNKIQGNPNNFHNDLCVGAVQVIQGGTIIMAKGVANSTGIQTTTATGITSTDPTSQTFSNVATSQTAGRWNIATFTGSSRTGAADGISSDFQDSTTILANAGEENVLQVASTNFLYCEATGQTIGTIKWMKLPSVNLATSTAHTLSIAYHLAVLSAGGNDDEDDEILIFIEN